MMQMMSILIIKKNNEHRIFISIVHGRCKNIRIVYNMITLQNESF